MRFFKPLLDNRERESFLEVHRIYLEFILGRCKDD